MHVRQHAHTSQYKPRKTDSTVHLSHLPLLTLFLVARLAHLLYSPSPPVTYATTRALTHTEGGGGMRASTRAADALIARPPFPPSLLRLQVAHTVQRRTRMSSRVAAGGVARQQ